jgi:HD-GYP domain-containing protein (c-di-GMP phosphodiesterase class II)
MNEENLPFVLDVMTSKLVNSFNYDIPAISGDMLSFWSSYEPFKSLTLDNLTQNMPDYMVKKKLGCGELVENHYFNQFLENIQNHFESIGVSRKKVLEKYIAGFGDFSRSKLQSEKQFSQLTKICGGSLEALSYLPQDLTYLTTPFKDVSVDKCIKLTEGESKRYTSSLFDINPKSLRKISLNVSPKIQGIKTTEENFYFYFGSLKKILRKTSDTILGYDVTYDHATGKGVITATYVQESWPIFPQRAKLIKHFFPKVRENKKKAKKIIDTLTKKANLARKIAVEKNEEVFKRDILTGYHVNGMQLVMYIMLEVLGAKDTILRDALLGGALHDIGKATTLDEVFQSTQKFSPLERKIMEAHGPAGTLMVLNSKLELDQLKISLDNVVALTYLHHMPQNGNNYYHFKMEPEEIPMFGRVSVVADVFHALLEQRLYKDAIPIDEVLGNLDKWFPEGFFDPVALSALKDYVVPFFKRNLGENFTANDLNKILQSKFNGNIGFANNVRALANGNFIENEKLELFAPTVEERENLISLRGLAQKQPQKAVDKNDSRKLVEGYFTGFVQELRYLDMLGHVMENEDFFKNAPKTLQKFVDDNKKRRNSPNVKELSVEDRVYLDNLGMVESPYVIKAIDKLLVSTGESLEDFIFEEI